MAAWASSLAWSAAGLTNGCAGAGLIPPWPNSTRPACGPEGPMGPTIWEPSPLALPCHLWRPTLASRFPVFTGVFALIASSTTCAPASAARAKTFLSRDLTKPDKRRLTSRSPSRVTADLAIFQPIGRTGVTEQNVMVPPLTGEDGHNVVGAGVLATD